MKAQLVTEDTIESLPEIPGDNISKGERIDAHKRLMAAYEENKASAKTAEQEWGVYVICGLKGSGKTTVMSGLAGMFAAQGRVVISNVSLLFGYRVDAMSIYLLATRAPRGAVLVIDELHALLNRYGEMSHKNRAVISGLAGGRKKQLIIIGGSQQESQISPSFKGEVDYFLYPNTP